MAMSDSENTTATDSTGESTPVIVVSGLPRSGTSMMMKMLEAAGLEVVVDGVRTADDDNPKGYYEFERVKKLPVGDVGWVGESTGKVVKVISALLEHLPADQQYRVIFMRRRLVEVLRSQQKMLANRDEAADAVADEQLTAFFTKHLTTVEGWLESQPNVEAVFVDYNDMLVNPTAAVDQLRHFLDPAVVGRSLDWDATDAVVDPGLYRNRG
jgi:hypothetical protein